MSLHNDVLFSLLTVAQLVIDVAGDLSALRGDRFEDYREAIDRFLAIVRDIVDAGGIVIAISHSSSEGGSRCAGSIQAG